MNSFFIAGDVPIHPQAYFHDDVWFSTNSVSHSKIQKLVFALNNRSYHFTQSRRDTIIIDSSIDGYKTLKG
jgi:hypothetical protein